MTRSQRHLQRGQGMTEYIIIVALIAVAAIGVYQFFGQTIRSQTAGIAAEVSGQNAQAQIQQSQQSAAGANTEGQATKGLATYNNNTNANR
jgi:Flp pilus assembly pilin Flp